MSEIVAMIERMEAKGIACHVILEAVKALAGAKDDAIEERRASDRIRKARQRAALKEQGKRHVTSEDSTDSADIGTETPAPLSSPLLPSPTPLTNNPPIIPPSSEILSASASKSKREPNGSRLEATWSLTSEWLTEAFNAQPVDQLPLTEAEIRHEADKFRDYWLGQPGAKGRKLDWLGTWRNWIRRAAPQVIRARPRADRGSDASRPRGAAQFAPNVGLFDALALAGAKARNGGQDAPRGADHGDGAGEPRRIAAVEILDREDARGFDARKTGGDRSAAGAVILPLSAASGR